MANFLQRVSQVQDEEPAVTPKTPPQQRSSKGKAGSKAKKQLAKKVSHISVFYLFKTNFF
jgi:hypothetical protein